MSLQPAGAGQGGFEPLRAENRRLSRFELLTLRFLGFLAWVRLDTAVAELDPWRDRNSLQLYCPDGWCASFVTCPDRRFTMQLLETNFKGQPVDPATIGRLLQRVQAWTAAGIVVYAFRPPTCAPTIAAEARLSEFDEQDFVRRFEAVGGVWIPIAPLAHECPDGSHVHHDSALDLSRAVAGVLATQRPSAGLANDRFRGAVLTGAVGTRPGP